MKTGYRSILLISVLFIFVLFQLPGSVVKDTQFESIESIAKSNKDKGGKLVPDVNFGNIPLFFIHNKGQVDKKALFYAKTPGYTLWVTKEGLVFDSIKYESKTNSKFENLNSKLKNKTGGDSKFKIQNSKLNYRDVSRLLFVGSNKNPEILSLDPQKLKVNYLKGNDKSKWVGGVPTSGAVLYKNLYKKIDLKVYGIGKQIEYDWIVNPGGDPSDIKFEYKNVKEVNINKKGDLDITTQFGTLTHKKPFSYQNIGVGAYKHTPVKKGVVRANIDSPLQEIKSSFKKIKKTIFGFSTGKYDKTKSLIIDPRIGLEYSTYLGGVSYDSCSGIAADNNGYVYVTGGTGSTDFPVSGGYQTTHQGGWEDIFVTKIDTNQSGSACLLYSTYLGGNGYDSGNGIAIDNDGYVYVTGETTSTDFPVSGGYQTTCQGEYDAFVTCIDTNRSGAGSLLYSTYLGGSSSEKGLGIAADNIGYVYVTGYTTSLDFPVSGGYQTTHQGGWCDVFVTKIDTNQSGSGSLLYSTYLGGGGDWDWGLGIAADNNGYVYVTGRTDSINFPVSGSYQTTYQGSSDAFVTKIDTNQNGSGSLLYSTYLGGGSEDRGYGIAADNNGNVYVTGYTGSVNFPVSGGYQMKNQGSDDVFVTKIDTTQSGSGSLLYSTYLGGVSEDYGQGIALDNNGYVYVTGNTDSTNFPTLGQYQGDQGSIDAFVTKIDTNQNGSGSFLYSTYLGGSNEDNGAGIAVDNNGYVYVAGGTYSTNFPTLGRYQGHQGSRDAFVTKLILGYGITSSVSGGNGTSSPVSQTVIEGDTASINFNPALGYMVGTIVDNGIDAVVQNPYRIYNVQEDHDVVVTFKDLAYKVIAEVEGGNGTVSPATQWVEPGENASITITPYTGYRIASITDNGNEMPISDPYIIHYILDNHLVKVKFMPDAYPPELSLKGVRKIDNSWTIKKEYAELKVSIVEHPVKPLEIATYYLLRGTNGNWEVIKNFNSPGEHTYMDKGLEQGEKAFYKLGAYTLDGSSVSESQILEL